MTTEEKQIALFDYDTHARTCEPTEFHKQVLRTTKGKPISSDQIDMILTTIHSHLKLHPEDVLLEFACGNGVLSEALFDVCKAYLGVDISPHLISIAKTHFERPGSHQFLAQDVLGYLQTERHPERFRKVLFYAGIQYFDDDAVEIILGQLFDRFPNVERILIGSVPDKDNASLFYQEPITDPGVLDNPRTAIGIWRTQATFEAIARRTGWNLTFSRMPQDFYSSAYRYDVTLVRPSKEQT